MLTIQRHDFNAVFPTRRPVAQKKRRRVSRIQRALSFSNRGNLAKSLPLHQAFSFKIMGRRAGVLATEGADRPSKLGLVKNSPRRLTQLAE